MYLYIHVYMYMYMLASFFLPSYLSFKNMYMGVLCCFALLFV